jgi:sirohydrochlorin cobaltochelatase
MTVSTTKTGIEVSPLATDTPGDAVLLVGHGTRDPIGVREFFRLAERVGTLLAGSTLEACFLEIAEPTIVQGLEKLLVRGAKRVTVVPLLLTAAGHAKRDIPQAVAAVARLHPGLAIRQTAALDCHPQVVGLSTQRYDESVGGRPSVRSEETLLLVVGRGSSDPAAASTVRQFAALRAERSQVGRVETCFAAVARPSLDEALPVVAAAGYRRIVVQPHLLFHGRLLADIRQKVERFRDNMPSAAANKTASEPKLEEERQAIEWILAEPLGPAKELALAVVDLIGSSENGPAESQRD